MTEPTIVCPNCRSEIRLTESLAAPLIEATRAQYEQRLARQSREYAEREQAVQERERALAEEREQLQAQIASQVAAQLKQDRARIAREEAERARLALGAELDDQAREAAGLRELLKAREEKLAQAQQAQAELIRKQRELDDARRELELTVETRVQQGLQATREQARLEAEAALGLKVAEKEQTISAMARQIEELKRRAEQSSQQLQGEVLELELENLLRGRFPFDAIEPVAKGEFGGDVLQRVVAPGGQACGEILWESKRTKHWSDLWLTKLRADQRAARAEIAILVSQALPKGIDSFELVDGVFVVHPRVALPMAGVLRQSLIEIATARQAAAGQQTKTELIYQYLTGPHFRHRVEAIVEAFTTMQEDLEQERKLIMRQWAKRAKQIERVMTATVGMYGDLQGIAGRSLQEIEGLSLPALEDQGEAPDDEASGDASRA